MHQVVQHGLMRVENSLQKCRQEKTTCQLQYYLTEVTMHLNYTKNMHLTLLQIQRLSGNILVILQRLLQNIM